MTENLHVENCRRTEAVTNEKMMQKHLGAVVRHGVLVYRDFLNSHSQLAKLCFLL